MSSTFFSFLKSLFPGGPVYVRIRKNNLDLMDASSGERFSCSTNLLVYENESLGKATLESVFRSPGEMHAKPVRVNGFDHPRTLLMDFVVAEKTLQLALAELFKGRWFRPSPVIVIHPLEMTEGGLTTIEVRALRELCEGAGARGVIVWEGRELTEVELTSAEFLQQQLRENK